MHVQDTRRLQQVPAHLVQVNAPGRRLQQHVDGLAQQAQGARDDQQADAERDDGVGAGEAGQPDRQGGGQDRHRAEQVVEDLQVRAADVEAGRLALRQQQQRHQVAHRADDAEDDHRARPYRFRVDQPLHGLVEDEGRKPEQDHRVHGGREDLRALPAERPLRRRRAAGNPHREQRQGHPVGVRRHVSGVGQQR